MLALATVVAHAQCACRHEPCRAATNPPRALACHEPSVAHVKILIEVV